MRSLARRLRHGVFTAQTRERLQSWIVFVGVPLMLVLVAILMVTVGSWVSEAQQREQMRNERTQQAVEQIIREIRQPETNGERDTREETFDRIRQLCEVHEGCHP